MGTYMYLNGWCALIGIALLWAIARVFKCIDFVLFCYEVV